ncbi:MAG: protoglobin domain-containing protein, partial [Planctomycetaceae bacterium]
MKNNQPNSVPSDDSRPDENLKTISDIKQRLDFLELNEADVERLRGCKDALQKYSSHFVETFYRHLLAFEDTAQFLRDPVIVDRLKELQQAHLESMLDANWDEAYVERRTQV